MAFEHLSPIQAASAADTVYDLKKETDVGSVFEESDVAASFDFSGGYTKRVQARTGAFEFKSKTGFGVIAKGTGTFSNDAIIICRGTAGLYDVLTDVNTGLQKSRTGHFVHAGFNRSFNDFAEDILAFLRLHKPKVVHCVGHSLGGALATLAADLVSHQNLSTSTKAALYTFGCPRVGFSDFADKLSLSAKIGVSNIHRVYHAGDPVAMLPLWPFVHAPQPKGECYIGKSLGFWPPQHKMGNYLKSVHGHEKWNSLRMPQPSIITHMDDWLSSAQTTKHLGLNFYNLNMIMGAIRHAIHDAFRSALTPAGMFAIGGATLLDGLSIMLEKSATMSTESNSFVMSIMKRVANMLGIVVQQGQKLTHLFIRYVLQKLTFALNRLGILALQTGI